MRWLISFLLIFALAVTLSLVTRYSDSYALLIYPPYRIEISLPVLIATLLLSFFGAYLLLRGLSHTLSLPSYIAAYRRRRRDAKGQSALRHAWEAFLEGRYARAHRYAVRAFEMHTAPTVSALLAARAAHALRAFPRRDEWLDRAAQVPGHSRRAQIAARAEMLLDERRFDEARALLRELHEHGPKQVATLRLMLRAEQGAQNWDEVIRLVRILEKRDPLSRLATEQMRITAIVEGLKRKGLDSDGLRAFWRELSSQEKREPRIAAIAARLFMGMGGCKEAHKIIADALNAEWSSELALLYGECEDEDALDRIQQCEAWLKSRPRDPALLLTLGRLCVYCQLWGKAASYLEASLNQQPTRTAHRELAKLCERLEKFDDANKHYKKAADEGIPA
ncbi:MAG TPA: heme biosynthesis HemY N-terminal domain-containing protein [Burkholderiales bacterium]|nr:heme biosynthesis HemY N-terminal domain-containing protein [Burkholderiales bacterium]